jgi:diguanylate cyclase (GGDEF)-like protein
MPSIDLVSLAALHILTPAGLSLLLLHFYRRHQKTYVRSWSLFWAWSALFTALSWIVYVYMHDVPLVRPDRWLLATAEAVAGFVAIGHLISGTYDLLHRRPIRLVHARRMFFALVIAGLLLSLYLASLTRDPALVHLAGAAILSIAFGTAFLLSSVFFWQKSQSERTSWILLAVTFGIFGSAHVVNLLLEMVWMGTSGPLDHAGSVVVVGAFLQGMVGLAMIIRLLDDERQAAIFAASQVEHMAYHDDLTGLPNRSLFFDRLIIALTQAERRDRNLAILFLDLDHFKDINDSLGHSIGDALLRVTAERLAGLVRKEDTVARFGGDEFVILMTDLRSSEDTAKIAQKLIDTVREPFNAYEREIVITGSVGIAIYPDDGTQAEVLVKNADTAMYRAKELGRNRYQLYTAAMNERALERLELEMALRRALDNDEFELHYQPLVDVASRKLIGFEALLRWNHITFGLLMPDHFVPAAERCGLIVPIGQWVMNEVARQAAEWKDRLGRDFFISINLSASELMEDDLVESITSIVGNHGVAPEQIEIEITESSAFRDDNHTADVLRRLRDLGFRISIDDFGTGYSSLSYLKTFPVDTLKIDKMFLQDINGAGDAAITNSVISMAHGMNLKVVAEGVENVDQVHVLSGQSCDRFQGFLFSQPLPARQIEEFVIDCDLHFLSIGPLKGTDAD